MISRSFVALVLFLGAATATSILACGGSSEDGPAADAGPDVDPTPRIPGRDTGPDEPYDANVATWCSAQGQHSFCADFDGKKLLEGWRAFGSSLTPTFSAAPSDRSPPSAFSVTQPAASLDAGPPPASFTLSKSFAKASPTSIHVGLDLQIEKLGLDGNTFAATPVMIALTHQEGTTTNYSLGVQLSRRATKTELHLWGRGPDSGFGPSGGGDITELPLGPWVHVELDLKLTPTGGTASVTFDGKPAGSFDITGADTSDLNGAVLEIGARDAQYEPADSVFLFDNVIADVK